MFAGSYILEMSTVSSITTRKQIKSSLYFNSSNSSNTEDANKTKTNRDKKEQKGLPSETLSSTDNERTTGRIKNKVDNEKEMGTRDLHHKETSDCKGR